MSDKYGKMLCFWRKKRRYSQLALALMAGISARHLSFLESGRASPSREMVIRLADSLDMPKQQVNKALLGAGFSPVYIARAEHDVDLVPINNAVQTLIEKHMPYPALVMDASWNIINANPCAMILMSIIGFSGQNNLLEALLTQTREESFIINWDEAVALSLVRARTELEYGEENELLRQHVENLEKHFDKYSSGQVIDRSQAVFPTLFQIDDKVISLFSTMAHFSTVQDITISDLKVELMFPMDQLTEDLFQKLSLSKLTE